MHLARKEGKGDINLISHSFRLLLKRHVGYIVQDEHRKWLALSRSCSLFRWERQEKRRSPHFPLRGKVLRETSDMSSRVSCL